MLGALGSYLNTAKGLGLAMAKAGLHRFLPGLYMGWGLGANDSANVFGTAVATRVVSYRRAIWLTAIFVMLGACYQGPMVMPLFKKLSALAPTEAILAALGAAISMHLMTHLGIPSSSSQAIVGSVLGIGILRGTAQFKPLVKVVICWVATPIGAAFFSFLFFYLFRALFNRFVKNIRVFDTIVQWGIVLAGCYGAYSLGANNVGNVCGVYFASGLLDAQQAALLGGFGIALGALTYSRKVMMTVGHNITALDPFSAGITILAAAVTVHIFVYVGVPVSTSQAAVGAVAGVGLVKGAAAVSRKTLGECVLGWLATPLVAGFCSVAFVLIIRFF